MFTSQSIEMSYICTVKVCLQIFISKKKLHSNYNPEAGSSDTPGGCCAVRRTSGCFILKKTASSLSHFL